MISVGPAVASPDVAGRGEIAAIRLGVAQRQAVGLDRPAQAVGERGRDAALGLLREAEEPWWPRRRLAAVEVRGGDDDIAAARVGEVVDARRRVQPTSVPLRSRAVFTPRSLS